MQHSGPNILDMVYKKRVIFGHFEKETPCEKETHFEKEAPVEKETPFKNISNLSLS